MSLAVLAYDSDAAMASLGTRGFATGQTRSLLFQGCDLSIDVLMQGAGPIQILHGQVAELNTGLPAVGVRIAAGEEQADSDALGQFTLSVLDRHLDRLWIEAGDRTMVCEFPPSLQR